MPKGLVMGKAHGSVAEVVQLLTAELRRRGIEVFGTIDHAGGARAAGLELADEVLVIFGNPAVGTALIQADPRVGIDLPLRMLVWSEEGTTMVAFQDPAALADRYSLGGEGDTLAKLHGLLMQLFTELAAVDVTEQQP